MVHTIIIFCTLEQYYVGRVRKPGGGYACGKIHPSHECCYVSYGTREHGFKNYEVLVKL